MKKIVIVGLGLMGGSLAAAVRKKFPRAHVVGVARRAKTLQFAKKKKWIHEGSLSLRSVLTDADLVVICVPVDLTEKMLTEIDQLARKPVLVTDVGSVKAPIEKFLKKKKLKMIHFTGAHPMVGSHEKGIESTRPNLYQNGLTIVTGKKNQPGRKAVVQFWKKISKRVREMEAPQHDLWAAEISHLPHLLSTCLMLTVSQSALQIASSGFRDTTRLAEGAASVWQPIFSQNKAAMLRALIAFKSNLNQLESSLKRGSTRKLSRLLSVAGERRYRLTHA